MHFLEHFDFDSLVHRQAHQRTHEWHRVCDAQCAEISFTCVFAPCRNKVLLLKPLLLVTGKVDLPVLKNLLLRKLSLLLRQLTDSIDGVVLELSEDLDYMLASDLILMIGGDSAQVLHHWVHSIGWFLHGWLLL